jgi:hypothetical protein
MCGDNATWIQATYTDLQGVLQYGWMTAGLAGAVSVANCPSAYCENLQPPEWSCRQVTTDVGVTLFKQPCYDQKLRVTKSDLQKWDTIQYYGAYSKQTSKCAQGNRQDLCFVKARANLDGNLQEGWVPVFRTTGKFIDSVCSFSQGASNQVFLRSYCGKFAVLSDASKACSDAQAVVLVNHMYC